MLFCIRVGPTLRVFYKNSNYECATGGQPHLICASHRPPLLALSVCYDTFSQEEKDEEEEPEEEESPEEQEEEEDQADEDEAPAVPQVSHERCRGGKCDVGWGGDTRLQTDVEVAL